MNPTPADADGELVAEWMESLEFNWGKTLKVWTIDDKILKPWVTPEQAAFFYQQFQSEKAKAALDATESLISRLSAWAVGHDLTRGSYKKVTFDVDEWNAVREELAQLSHPAPELKSDKE